MSKTNIPLTSSEIASIWAAYLNDSMAIQFLSYFLNIVEDPKVRLIIETGHSISSNHLSFLTDLFKPRRDSSSHRLFF
ncbi:DUF3231 family protein [Bacillus sp. AFS076308]|uniref:DUF3231 family protein n=1 Tax=unclassified Bacillus (in: firmicutes) TaxID=185979 RepID=UPI00267DEC7E|nr:DUF3231 family protein [Bacillus sp. AFS076308]